MPEYLSVLAENAQKDLENYKSTAEEVLKVVLDTAKAATSVTQALGASSTQKDLSGNFTKATQAQDELTLSVREYARVRDNIAIQEAKLTALQSEAAKQQANNAAAIREASKALRDEANATNEAFQKRLADNQARKEQIVSQKAQSAASKALEAQQRKEQKALEDLNNEYKLLQQQLDIETKKYQQLFLTAGEFNKVTLEQQKRVQELDGVLKKIDANTGNYRRNVGNYAAAYSGLGNSIQQILREAPSAAVSLNTFFLAISNNLPIFFDELKKINEEQKIASALLQEGIVVAREDAIAKALQAGATSEAALAEAALAEQTLRANSAQKAAPGILTQVGKSLFSVNTLLTLGVLALTLFGGKIIDAIKNIGGQTEASEKLKVQLEEAAKFQKELTEAEGKSIGTLQTLYTITQDQALSMKQRTDAVKELQKEYPAYFGNLSTESVLAGKAANAYLELRDALISSAAARVYQGKVDEALGKELDLTEKITAKQRELAELKNTSKFTPSVNGVPGSYNVGDPAADSRAVELSEELRDLEQERTEQVRKRSGYLDEIERRQKTRLREDPEKARKAQDTNNATLKAEQDYTKELYAELSKRAANEAEIAKGIAENESNTFDQRKAAYDRYSHKRLESAGYTLAGEYEITQEGLDRIAEIEKKSADKRTNQEKNLLLQKDTLTQRQINIAADYDLTVTKIVNDNVQETVRLTEEGLKQLDQAAKNMSEGLYNLYGFGNKKPKREKGGLLHLTDQDKKDLENVNSYTDAAISAFQGLSDVLDQISAKRRAQTQQEIDLIDKRKEKELDAINASTLSEDERAKRIADLNARADAQKEALAAQQKKRDIDDARRAKALTIVKIIAETALAVVHQLGSGDGYTALGRAVAAGVAGAAALASAIAAPIPSFAEGAGVDGRPLHKGGKALVGEGGQPELIMEPGKKPYAVDSPQILNLRAGTRVIPESKLDSFMFADMSAGTLMRTNQKGTDVSGVENRLDKWGRKHYEAILKNKLVIKKSTFDNNLFNWSNR